MTLNSSSSGYTGNGYSGRPYRAILGEGAEAAHREQPTEPAMADWAFLPQSLQNLREGHERPEEFWNEVAQLVRMAREREFVTGARPESFASDEEWQRFWRAAGWPDSPAGYRTPEAWSADGVAPALAEAVTKVLMADKDPILQICHAANLTDRQARSIWQHYGGIVAKVLELEETEKATAGEAQAKLWPENTDSHMAAARRGARHAGIANELDSSGLSENPLVLKLAHALGEMLGEAGMPGAGGASSVLPTGQAAKEEMYRLIGTDAYRDNDPALMRKLEALAGRVHMG